MKSRISISEAEFGPKRYDGSLIGYRLSLVQFQALVLILFGVCTTLDGNSILKLEGENGTKRVIIPAGANPMMGSYGSKCLL